ncbi:acetamidase formamidase [Moniliophthora roreri]|nr:acetamidase formamidase [Moniliophthora roreri]
MSIHAVKQNQCHLVWDNNIQPVLRIKSGEIVTIDCLDASNGAISPESDAGSVAALDVSQVDQVNGPIYVEGAHPGDTLKVDVISVETAEWAWTGLIPGFGLLADDFPEPVLKIWTLNKTEGFAYFDREKGIKIPLKPFPGEMGVAQARSGAFSTIPPYHTGGNLDTKHLTAGSTLYLPVEVEGALFSIGDGHAAQGDGEVCGTAIETPMQVQVRLTAVKDRPYTKTPHFETLSTYQTGPYYGITGVGPDIKEATKSAVRHAIQFLRDEHGLSAEEAYMLCSVAGDLRMHEVVDMPNYVGKEKAIADHTAENPFIVRLRAPVDETEEERIRRVRALQDAQKTSREIDESLQESKKHLDRRRRGIRLLLLGQAESGKSAVLKNFQMAFTPSQFQRERVIWKTIIQLNLIQHIRIILDALSTPESPGSPSDSDSTSYSNSPTMSRSHRRLHLSLSPLLSTETSVSKILSASRLESRDLCVRAGSSWKSKLGIKDSARSSTDSDYLTQSQMAAMEDLTRMLEASRDDLLSLWGDLEVRTLLATRKIFLHHLPGFFLDDIPRIAMPGRPADIVRARLRTVGVEEHHLICETEAHKGSEFFIADVGGARSSRYSWVPFFDDAQAILFLAPLSFNQMLEEDPRVNRLEDTLTLWKEICANTLLADCNLIIFFNKKDILAKTLEAGVSVKHYVPSYDGPNDVPSITKYFKDRFKGYHKKFSPKSRPFISYETSAIDTRAMKALILVVHDGIIRNNLARSDMI